MEYPMSKQFSKEPETAKWKVKGDGIAYTSSKAILNSQAGRKLVEQAGKVQLTKDSGSSNR